MELYCFTNGEIAFSVKGRPKEIAEYMTTIRELNEISVDFKGMMKQMKGEDDK